MSSRVFARLIGALAVVCLLAAISNTAQALPRFSLLTGTRCSACHFDPQGSGIRTELGWEMMNQTGLVQWHGPDTTGVLPTNELWNKRLILGGDARLQLVRLSTTGAETLIPMQLMADAAVMPCHSLSIYGGANIASIYERHQQGPLYPGEGDFTAAVQYEPGVTLPSIRAGMIQPSIGVRQDDHTAFVRREVALQEIDLIPPDYNEVGAELTYEGIRWVTVNAGIFNAYNLSQIDPTIGTVKNNFDFSHPTVSARVMFWPQLLDQGLNGEVGGSILSNGSFKMYNGFVGLGLADKATIYLEGLYADNAEERRVRNYSVIGTYQLIDWLSMDWRYDWGQTELYPGQNLGWANAFTFGFEFFPAPYIELRPEYRLTQSNPNTGAGTYTGQYTGQIHIFY